MRTRILSGCIGIGVFVGLLPGKEDGAEPRKTGGPFPSESVCTECHSNPPFRTPNSGPGSVDFAVQAYRPGETQRITVSVADPSANRTRWGFQITARPASNLTQQAGRFRAVDNNVQVICDNDQPAPPSGCPSGMLEFATHTLAGTRLGTPNGVQFQVDWTAPPTDVGEIIFAAAGNAANGNRREDGDNIYTKQVRVSAAGGFTSVSSASFAQNAPLAAELIASGFGTGLARGTAVATTIPLPTELLGTRVEVTDSQNTSRPAPLFFVSPGQINYLIPAGTALGAARVTVTSGAGGTITGSAQIERVAPALYTANAQGTGVAAALFLRVAGDGTRTQDLIFNPNTRASVPIDLGGASDQVFLLLFGTGIRGASAGSVTAVLGGQSIPVVGFAPQGQFVGLDQVNLGPIPRALAGRGEVDLVVTVEGKAANTVRVNIR